VNYLNWIGGPMKQVTRIPITLTTWSTNMLEMLIYILIVMIIGWNLPQPGWATKLQESITAYIKKESINEEL